MTRVIMAAVALAAIAGGIYLHRALSVPQSAKVRAEIEKVIASPDNGGGKLVKLDMLHYDLAAAYESEGRYPEAAEIYKEKIGRLRREDAVTGRRLKESLNLEARYFDNLERIYRLAQDAASADQAKKSAAQARAQAKRTARARSRYVP